VFPKGQHLGNKTKNSDDKRDRGREKRKREKNRRSELPTAVQERRRGATKEIATVEKKTRYTDHEGEKGI